MLHSYIRYLAMEAFPRVHVRIWRLDLSPIETYSNQDGTAVRGH
jgi:hypothetical protein